MLTHVHAIKSRGYAEVCAVVHYELDGIWKVTFQFPRLLKHFPWAAVLVPVLQKSESASHEFFRENAYCPRVGKLGGVQDGIEPRKSNHTQVQCRARPQTSFPSCPSETAQ